MNNKTFTLLNQTIAWTFYWRVVQLSGSTENANRMFLRACANKADDIKKWIMGGIARNGYAWNACSLEYEKALQCARWIERVFGSAKPGPKQVNQVLVETLENMLAEAKGNGKHG